MAAATFPTLEVSGRWSDAFEMVADVLTGRLAARRAEITGAQHDILDTGECVNRVLEGLWSRAGAQD